ncbi:hypothetical protein [Telluribacter humicola]|uniref:hypothetical protein n=1 Tax=Telluribacter humicola TaxID=1720261 RepID=UPI001A97AA60|nr:hypothetical protein [Telluribacter humicola]
MKDIAQKEAESIYANITGYANYSQMNGIEKEWIIKCITEGLIQSKIHAPSSGIKWIQIDKDNLPEGLVLAANFTPDTQSYKEKMMGSLHVMDGVVCCVHDYDMLSNCTHYIDIHKFDVLEG